MALSRIESEILVFRHSLEKATEGPGGSDQAMVSCRQIYSPLSSALLSSLPALLFIPEPQERILDILKSLKLLTLTPEIIKSTKIGLSVNTIKKKFDGEVGRLAKELIQNWKKIYNNSQPAGAAIGPAATPPEDSTAVAATEAPSTQSGTPDDISEKSSADSPRPAVASDVFGKLELDSIPEGRRNVRSRDAFTADFSQIIKLMTTAFEPDEADGYAREVLVSIARGIELTINNRYSFTSDRENYQTRARKLIFNLKKNKVLSLISPLLN